MTPAQLLALVEATTPKEQPKVNAAPVGDATSLAMLARMPIAG